MPNDQEGQQCTYYTKIYCQNPDTRAVDDHDRLKLKIKRTRSKIIIGTFRTWNKKDEPTIYGKKPEEITVSLHHRGSLDLGFSTRFRCTILYLFVLTQEDKNHV